MEPKKQKKRGREGNRRALATLHAHNRQSKTIHVDQWFLQETIYEYLVQTLRWLYPSGYANKQFTLGCPYKM